MPSADLPVRLPPPRPAPTSSPRTVIEQNRDWWRRRTAVGHTTTHGFFFCFRSRSREGDGGPALYPPVPTRIPDPRSAAPLLPRPSRMGQGWGVFLKHVRAAGSTPFQDAAPRVIIPWLSIAGRCAGGILAFGTPQSNPKFTSRAGSRAGAAWRGVSDKDRLRWRSRGLEKAVDAAVSSPQYTQVPGHRRPRFKIQLVLHWHDG
ncbi:hypothetical protein OF83DRAFT_79201 [Amylostereum chailletii]|nr:hypothetical protein OF83DRAFT_79201 [Amylostereum chailletii]